MILSIFKIRYILVIILFLTIITLILYPSLLYEDYRQLDYQVEQIDYSTGYCFVPNDWGYHIFSLYEDWDENRLFAELYNFKNRRIKYSEYYGSSLNSVFKKTTDFYYDKQWDRVFFVGSGNDHVFSLNTVDRNMNIKGKKIKLDSLFFELTDPLLYLEDIPFKDLLIRKYASKDYKIEFDGNAYVLFFSLAFWEKMLNEEHIPPKTIENENFQEFKLFLEKYFATDLTSIQVWEFITRFNRKKHFQKKIYYKIQNKDHGLLKYKSIAGLDGNGDGVDDILMYRRSECRIAAKLLLYDYKNDKILWQRYFSQHIPYNFFSIVDIENDGKKEILVSTYSNCSEPPPEFFKCNLSLTMTSQFYIITNTGEIKTIDGKEQKFSYPKYGYYEYKYLFLPKDKKILLGVRVFDDFEDKKLQYADLETGEINDTDIIYNNIVGFRKNDGKIEVYDLDKGLLKKIILNSNFQQIDMIEKQINKKVSVLVQDISIQGRNYIILQNLILDNNLNVVCDLDTHIINDFYDNKAFFITSDNKLSYATFTREDKINPWIIVLLLVEIFLIILVVLLVHLIRIPFNSANESYFTVYCILRKLYFWQIKGNIKHFFKLPKKIAFSKKVAQNLLEDISRDYRKVASNDFLFFSYEVYQFTSLKLLQIIQVLVHDLKNEILLHKMQLDNLLNKKDKKSSNEILQTADDISQSAIMLSNLMHINKMYKEETNINEFWHELEANYLNDKKYEFLSFEKKVYSENFYVDKRILLIALKNLINNSLREIESGYVKIELIEKEKQYIFSIENPAEIEEEDLAKFKDLGFTTKKDGSGIGIPIALEIIENHQGKLNYYFEHGILKAEIVIPKKKQ
ncbi:MAG: HAMP domain-containing sensor histidine kinase [Candidatus Cloacimonadota bacterium]|nr:HAMP domain-containing sensor histidine kinase [Candidatus Cloacimonadota bacterium]